MPPGTCKHHLAGRPYPAGMALHAASDTDIDISAGSRFGPLPKPG